MAFRKTGDAPIKEILCACGGKIADGTCEKCGKEHSKEAKQTSIPAFMIDTPIE